MKNTGGPAYPLSDIPGNYFAPGMTILDYFAGQALAGMLARDQSMNMPIWIDAEVAYDYAEAMIAEKAKREAGE